MEGTTKGVRVIRPLRDGAGPFHDEPEDLASGIEARGLRLIEHSWHGQHGVLPYLEEEAIARLRHELGPLGAGEAEWKRENWEWWRRLWMQRAHAFLLTTKEGPIDATPAYSAAEALMHAQNLRGAIECGEAEKAAALAMLVASWVFIGGVSVRLAAAEPVAAKHRKAQRAKAKLGRATIQADEGGMRKRDLVAEALGDAGADAGTADVWPHLFAVLDAHGMEPQEAGAKDTREISVQSWRKRSGAKNQPEPKIVTFTFKGVQTMLRELRQGPAVKRGRPKKKPA